MLCWVSSKALTAFQSQGCLFLLQKVSFSLYSSYNQFFCPDYTKYAVQEKAKVTYKQLQYKATVMMSFVSITTIEQKFISFPDIKWDIKLFSSYLSESLIWFSLIS